MATDSAPYWNEGGLPVRSAKEDPLDAKEIPVYLKRNPVTDRQEVDAFISGTVAVSETDLTVTVPNAATVTAVDSTIVAAGATGERDIVVAVPTTADTGIYVNFGAAATSSKFLMQPGSSLKANTNQALHALRAGAADVTVYLMTGVPA